MGNSLKLWVGTGRDHRVNERGYEHRQPVAEGVVLTSAEVLAGGVDVGLRWAFRERIARLPGRELALGTSWPILNVEATRYIDGLWEGELDGWRVAARLDKTFRMSLIGDLSFVLMAAAAQDDLPMTYLFNLRGTNSNGLNLAVPATFETMRPNAFQADRFAAAHVSHDFGTLLGKGKHFRPRPGISFSAGIAELKRPQEHGGMAFAAMADPYMEAGVRVEGVFAGLGVAAFTPVGTYSTGDLAEDVVLKLTYRLPF